MKFKTLFLLLVLSLGLALSSCTKDPKPEEDYPEVVTKLKSYRLSGKLYSIFPSGTKECLITVYYKSPDLYRVEIDNAVTADKQILLKNSDGVHVLIPSINKSFKIKSGWPVNSSYPYLLQSLSKDIVADQNPIVTSNDTSTTIEVEVKMFENALPSTQKIIFNKKSNMPEEVLVYDQNKNLVTRFVFEGITLNPNLDNDLFETNKTVANIRDIYDEIEISRDITYPTYFPVDTSLREERITGTSQNKVAIMKYAGASNYTIIQEFVNDNTDFVTAYLDGDIIVYGATVFVVNTNTINFYYSGVEYVIASNDVDVLEMIKIGDSLLLEEEK